MLSRHVLNGISLGWEVDHLLSDNMPQVTNLPDRPSLAQITVRMAVTDLGPVRAASPVVTGARPSPQTIARPGGRVLHLAKPRVRGRNVLAPAVITQGYLLLRDRNLGVSTIIGFRTWPPSRDGQKLTV